MAEDFMTIWDYIPDPGPAVRDPMWRQHALYEFTHRVEQPASAQTPAKDGGEARSATALLRAIIDDAGVGRRRPRDVAIIEAAITASIPADVPSFVEEILSVRPSDEGLVARVRLFDGGIGIITVSAGSEPAVRDWEAEGDQRDFGHLGGVWVRVDDPVTAPPSDEPEPAVEQAPAEEPSAMDRLVASGIANEYIAGLGALRDPDAPFSPRSIGFPVTVHRVGGPFQPPTAPRIWELHLSTPACGDLPFVRRVEEVTGLKARWAPDLSRGICGQWAHAVDLANDADWERLASSMEHTEAHLVDDAVGVHVADGSLGVANGRRLLLAVGVSEPETRACPNLRPNYNGSFMSLVGWEAIHAVEDGLVVPGNPKRNTYARVTDAGWRSVGKEPPAPKPTKAKRSLTKPSAEDVAFVMAAIDAILPKGVPTYVKEVLSVGRVPRSNSRRIIEIVLWDDGIGRMEISGEPGAHGYHWKTTGGDARPFHWDEAERSWVRVDEPEA